MNQTMVAPYFLVALLILSGGSLPYIGHPVVWMGLVCSLFLLGTTKQKTVWMAIGLVAAIFAQSVLEIRFAPLLIGFSAAYATSFLIAHRLRLDHWLSAILLGLILGGTVDIIEVLIVAVVHGLRQWHLGDAIATGLTTMFWHQLLLIYYRSQLEPPLGMAP